MRAGQGAHEDWPLPSRYEQNGVSLSTPTGENLDRSIANEFQESRTAEWLTPTKRYKAEGAAPDSTDCKVDVSAVKPSRVAYGESEMRHRV